MIETSVSSSSPRPVRPSSAATGDLFGTYHLHVPWVIPAAILVDTFAISYPAQRYRSAWIGIAVHSVQSVFLTIALLVLVLD
jgi:hypothetical protein